MEKAEQKIPIIFQSLLLNKPENFKENNRLCAVIVGLFTPKEDKIEIFVVVSVFLLGFFFFLWIFLRNQLVPMIDGPYYLIQVRSLLTTGRLFYGDPPLTFYLLSLFSVLLGDITLGVKVGAAFFSALSIVPAYFLMKRAGRDVFAGLTAMIFVIFSAPYIRMLSEFIKNAVGICWLFAFIYYLHDLALSGFKKSSLALATFFLVLTGLTHILDFGVALLFLLFYTIMVSILNVNRRTFLKAVGVITLVTYAFVFIAFTFFSFFFTDFFKAFSFISDLTTPKGNNAPTPSPVPTSGPQPPTTAMDTHYVVGDWILILLFCLGAVLSFYLRKKKEKEALLLLSVTTVVGSTMCFPFIPTEWVSRFQLMTVIPTTIILSYGISKIWSQKGKLKFFAFILFMIVLALHVTQAMSTVACIRPTISEAGYLDLVNMKNQIPPNSIIAVTDYGIRYWVEYICEVNVTHGRINELPPDLWQSYSHVLGLFIKEQVPSIQFKTIFVGNVYILVELQQSSFNTPQ